MHHFTTFFTNVPLASKTFPSLLTGNINPIIERDSLDSKIEKSG